MDKILILSSELKRSLDDIDDMEFEQVIEVLRYFKEITYNILSHNLDDLETFILSYLYNNGPINILHEKIVKDLFYKLSPEDINIILDNFIEKINNISTYTEEGNVSKLHFFVRQLKKNIPKFHKYMKNIYKLYDETDMTKRKSISHLYQTKQVKDDFDPSEYLLYFQIWLDYINNNYNHVCVPEYNDSSIELYLDEYPSDIENNHKLLVKAIAEYKVREYYEFKNLLIIPELLELIHNCKKQQLIVPLHIKNRILTNNHVNALIFDILNKKIYRFEPEGQDTETDIILEQNLKDYPSLKEYQYIPTTVLCPYILSGPQTIIRTNLNKLTPKEKNEGYCMMWSFMFMHYCIMNPDMSPEQVFNYIIQRGKLYESITEYTNWMQTLFNNTFSYENKKIETLITFLKNGNFDIQKDKNMLLNSIYTDLITFDKFINLYFASEYLDITRTKNLLDYIYSESKEVESQMANDLSYLGVFNPKYLPRPIDYYTFLVKKSIQNHIRSNYTSQDERQEWEEMFRYYFDENLF